MIQLNIIKKVLLKKGIAFYNFRKGNSYIILNITNNNEDDSEFEVFFNIILDCYF